MCGGKPAAPPPPPPKVKPVARTDQGQATGTVVNPQLRALAGDDQQPVGTLGSGQAMGSNARVTMLGGTKRNM